MRARRVLLLVLIVLTLLFIFDYSQGGFQKIGTQLSQLIILPTPTGDLKTLDENWFGE